MENRVFHFTRLRFASTGYSGFQHNERRITCLSVPASAIPPDSSSYQTIIPRRIHALTHKMQTFALTKSVRGTNRSVLSVHTRLISRVVSQALLFDSLPGWFSTYDSSVWSLYLEYLSACMARMADLKGHVLPSEGRRSLIRFLVRRSCLRTSSAPQDFVTTARSGSEGSGYGLDWIIVKGL